MPLAAWEFPARGSSTSAGASPESGRAVGNPWERCPDTGPAVGTGSGVAWGLPWPGGKAGHLGEAV